MLTQTAFQIVHCPFQMDDAAQKHFRDVLYALSPAARQSLRYVFWGLHRQKVYPKVPPIDGRLLHYFWAAERMGGGRILGAAICFQTRDWVSRSHTGQISNLFVDERCRRQGIGHALIEEIVTQATRDNQSDWIPMQKLVAHPPLAGPGAAVFHHAGFTRRKTCQAYFRYEFSLVPPTAPPLVEPSTTD